MTIFDKFLLLSYSSIHIRGFYTNLEISQAFPDLKKAELVATLCKFEGSKHLKQYTFLLKLASDAGCTLGGQTICQIKNLNTVK
jgi:hypothetical protein